MVERSPFGVWASESALAYPVANTAHVIGAILLVGSIGLFDLRVLGYARDVPLVALGRALPRLAVLGFGLMVISGAVLFASDARALAGSSLFQAKLIFIMLAGANALAFRRMGPLGAPPTFILRTLAALSLALWLCVVVAGRWIAYA